MPLPKYYNTGTASVANGATALTGTGTSWLNIVSADDRLTVQGLSVRIASVESNTAATLAETWPGTSLTDDPYEIAITYDGPEFQLRVRELLEQMAAVEANGRGLFYLFDSGTSDADPGDGDLRFNHATLASVTGAYIDNLDANGATVSSVLDTWDDSGASTTRGQLWVRAVEDPAAFRAYTVTGSVVDGTGYRKLTLVYVGGSGAFAAGDALMVFFSPDGASGAAQETVTYTYSSTTTAADPGAGIFRLNHATHASATALYIDNVEALAGATVTGWIDSWDDSTNTNKGLLRISKKTDPSIFRLYRVTGSVVDSTGYRTVTIAYLSGSGSLTNADACILGFNSSGDAGANGSNGSNGTNGTNGADGTGMFSRVRAVATSNITISTALNNGDSLDGVTLATNDLVLVAGQTAPAENGIYVVGAVPARDTSFDTYDEHPGVYVSVMEGTAWGDSLWRCTSNKGGTLNTTALTFVAPGWSVSAHKNASDQTGVVPNTPTKVTFGTEDWDTASCFASSTLTPPGGKCRISSLVNFKSTNMVDGATVTMVLYKNGSAHKYMDWCVIGAAAAVSVGGSVIVDANGTDTYEIYVSSSGAGNKTLDGTIAYTWFQAASI
jgi:hypothetical protein